MTAQHFFVMYINHAQRRTKNNLQKAITDMPDKTSLVRSYFDAIANRYDLMNTLLSFGLHHAWKNYTIKEAAINGDMHVLDVCGGTGDLAALASRKLNHGAAVTLYDFSLEMMLAGRRRANKKGRHIQYTCGDAQFLALKGQQFDVNMAEIFTYTDYYKMKRIRSRNKVLLTLIKAFIGRFNEIKVSE